MTSTTSFSRRLLLLCILTASPCLWDAYGFNIATTTSSSADRIRINRIFEQETMDMDVSGSSTVTSGKNLPPVIQSIADERAEFNMNLGKAMDTLRKDMPDILHKKPGKY